MDQWKNILAFNRAERRGIWILSVLILIISGINVYLRTIRSEVSELKIEVILAKSRTDNTWSNRKKYSAGSSGKVSGKIDSLFFFDPNTITSDNWQKLGLSEKQASVIKRYLSKGGRFRNKEDLKRSFVISESFFKRIEPWIRIDEPIKPNYEKATGMMQESTNRKTNICINTTDSIELTSLRGIGGVLAKRIISYRDALGGFHSVKQLEEVYGLSPQVVEMNNSKININTEEIRLISLNLASQQTLELHPYISKRLAYIIISLRKERRILSKEDMISRLPDGTDINPNLWRYLEY